MHYEEKGGKEEDRVEGEVRCEGEESDGGKSRTCSCRQVSVSSRRA
jgi:hypothetical protein